jgi:hypothetical protein
VDADTIGGTTGINQPPNAPSRSTWCTVKLRYGTATAQARPVSVPANHSTQSRSIAARSPIQSRPSSRAPAPTVSIAIGAAP